MKNKLITLSTLLLASLFVLTSHDKPETATGSISVKTTYNGTPMAEVLVGVSASPEDRENSTYISEKETDSKGMVTFPAINPGTYYLDAAFSSDDDESYYAEAEVTVTDTKVDVSIAMEIDE
jgi:uncharacterized GH25 family protein